MHCNDLPTGIAPTPVSLPHFPTRWQAFLWRNWGLLESERLAGVLGCSLETVIQAAEALGLPPSPVINPKWRTHGYLTLIRKNWHLLPYEQLLQLLDWTPEKLAYTLKEEDFLWCKLGSLKPHCQKVSYQPLDCEQQQRTQALRQLLRHMVSPQDMAYQDQPFAFAERFAPMPASSGQDRFDFNFIHSYAASCGDVLGNAKELDPVPENLLAQYASMGIKGVWMHAILYLLTPIPGAEEFSMGHEQRLQNLKDIVNRCAKYGIKVYLYLNEPRCMPLPFYDKKPQWGGIDVPDNHTKTICTTRTTEPLQWLEDSMRKLFTEASGLGGVFCITMSENPTNCHYHVQRQDCPSCKDVLPEKIIADIITAMERGMHAADPEAKMIAYDWAWRRNSEDRDNAPFKQCVMDRLPKSVYIASVSEWGKWTRIGGIEQYLVDYSISQVGPSQETLTTWKYAQSIGLQVAAKVQLNNSWELSAVPYIPVPYLIEEHLQNLKDAGVHGLMLSWTLGGFPGGNLELLRRTPEQVAADTYHPKLAEQICTAWKLFSQSFAQFPFNVSVLYLAPMNYGPMNLFHLDKTGYQATMIGFPYDDLNGWCGPYPDEILEQQFKLMTEGWKQGLDTLENAECTVKDNERNDFNELQTIATAAYCHLRSTYLQIKFVRTRNHGYHKQAMADCVREDIRLTKILYDIVRRDSRIGFEASNHYYYTLNDLWEKMISSKLILEQLTAPSATRV